MAKIKKRKFLKTALLLFLFSLLLATALLLYWLHINPLPDLKKLEKYNPKIASYVYDSNGKEIDKFFYFIRDPVKYEEIPKTVKQAFLAGEDKRFFEYKIYLLPWPVPFTGWIPAITIPGGHWGIDPLAIFRALALNQPPLNRYLGQVKAGASTITQQLDRLVFADDVPEFRIRPRTYLIKLKEMRIALWIDYYYSKEKIFESFCNIIYLGHGRFGIKEASRYYFGKELNQLNPAEAAMIVALNKYPKKFCPIHEPEAAKNRRNWVLKRMRDENYLTEAEYIKWGKRPIQLNVTSVSKNREKFGYGTDLVRKTLLDEGFDEETIWHYGGLRVYTTINSEIQLAVNEALNSRLDKMNLKSASKQKLQGAAVVIENSTGKILALNGGSNFLETKYNRAANKNARRQAGSAFKPFVYAAALQKGIGIADLICDCPLRLPGKIDFYGGVIEWWIPQNYEQKSMPPFMGRIPLWKGLALSRNVATINLARSLGGMGEVNELAHDMGIESPLDPYLPSAIGASSVNLLEMTSAYAVFANHGIRIKPYVIDSVKNRDGKILKRGKGKLEIKTILSPEIAADMLVLLRAVARVGTAKSASDLRQPFAGKTGTTNEFRDAWFIGFTPSFTVGVWTGYDMPENLGEKQSGAVVALPVFRDIIEKIYRDRPVEQFPIEVEEKLENLINQN